MNIKQALEYMNDSVSPEQKNIFEKWLAESEKNRSEYEHFLSAWQQKAETIKSYNPDKEVAWKQFAVKHGIDNTQVTEKQKSIIISSWRLVAAAAAVLLLITAYFFLHNEDVFKEKDAYMVYVAHDSVMNITLNDGSTVWLNRNSELKVAEWKESNNRQVFLKGEAFFDVTTDKHKPFIVTTGYTTTEVLGTSFNINNTEHTDIVTLVSGIIKFNKTGSGKKDALILKPGNQVSYNTLTKKRKMSVYTNQNFLAWKTGDMEFRNTPLPEVLETIAGCYDLTVSVNNNDMDKYYLTAGFHKQSLDKIIAVLELTWNLQITVSNDTLYLVNK